MFFQCSSLLFVWLLVLKCGFVRADFNETTPKYALLERVLQDADLKHNFLVAPHELHQLLATMLRDGKIETSADDDGDAALNSNALQTPYERYFTPSITAITVSNALKDAPPPDSKDHKAPLEAATQELLNSVAVNARWSINFQRRDTHKREFYMAPHDYVYTDAMRKDSILEYAQLPELNASAVELPLQRNALKLLILLPYAESDLEQLSSKLRQNLSLVEKIVTRRLRPELVRIIIPKFKFTFTMDVKDIFKEYASAATTPVDNIDFIDSVSKISHQAHISVAEHGIGDLERTTVLFWNAFSSVRTTPINFDIDRPFIFLLRNEKGIQFYGHLARL